MRIFGRCVELASVLSIRCSGTWKQLCSILGNMGEISDTLSFFINYRPSIALVKCSALRIFKNIYNDFRWTA